ncbi:ComF family protein [Lacibacter sediminis]|uniref:ComF family protein n=1 Tax=Lacibacter sediminis TaxID=2760713 RepID=A0A7G5XHI2_9BACT|nr:phosphoribosyltransferase family protein [Lacibacter sediminis]QNA44935.1 ComF family protein [Lacibacter sediminis]
MINTRKLFNDFIHLLYPHNCAGCGSDLLENDQSICIRCYTNLPETNYAALPGNPIEKIFYGRLNVEYATAGYYFSKSSVLQRLIHQLKYNGNIEVGHQLGQWLGLQLQRSNRFNAVDALIPLPLYPSKEKKRGYNQATVLCEGIAEIMNIPILNNIVLRKRYTDTQTKKGRTERLLNVDGSFEVSDAVALQQRHVLLVDDVITTGATLEACGIAIKETENVRLSIATLAWSSDD